MENTTPYLLEYDDKYFKFTASKSWFDKDRTLFIERETCRIKESEGQLASLFRCKKLSVQLIIGIIVISDQPFLSVVTSAQQVTLIIRQPVYQIKDVSFIAFRKSFNEKNNNYLQTSKHLDAIRNNILTDNFYFCHNYNLTLSIQKRNQRVVMETMFFWNQTMLKQLKSYDINRCWTIPIIQGFVKGFRIQTLNIPYEYVLIARRSKYQSGTRFSSRGVNNDGYVANFVQTQQIICFQKLILSWIILRGSVPMFWSQSGFGADIKIIDPYNQKVIVYKHFNNLKKVYGGNILVVDLLSDQSGTIVGEHHLQRKYQDICKQLQHEIGYLNFDLNEYVSKNKNNVQTAMDKWANKNKDYLCGDFFLSSQNNDAVYLKQTRFIRVNCLDCLDRTNVVQFKTSELMVNNFKQHINKYCQVEQDNIKFNEDFKQKHRQIWTQLGDKISLIYCGTTSVASYITKGQKSKNFFSSLGSGFKSLNRYYNANVNDTYKQQCIDWMLRASQDTKIYCFEDKASLQLNQIEYCEFQTINLTILTWNCAQVTPTNVDITALLDFSTQSDILIICFQEVVQLNTYNVLLGGSKKYQNKWRQSIEKVLKNNNKKMILVNEKDLVGILTLVFVSQNYFTNINSIICNSIKTGFKGNLGNKGAVVVSFKLNDTIFTIFNCHLQAGQGKSSQRLYSIDYIHNNCFTQKEQLRQYQNSDFKFLVGDLNFRVGMDSNQVKQLIGEIQKQKNYNDKISVKLSKLLQPILYSDELRNSMSKNQVLKQYSEQQIQFMPTYKFTKKTNKYSYKRTPSWCDRILYYSKNSEKLRKDRYVNKNNINCSDHKPVFSTFKLSVRKQDKNKKHKLFQQFMQW